MAARNKIPDVLNEWIKYGKIIYDSNGIKVIEGKEEFLITMESVVIHLTKDRVLTVIKGRRYVSTIPLRGRPRKGIALKVTLRVLNELPGSVSSYVITRLPLAVLAARG